MTLVDTHLCAALSLDCCDSLMPPCLPVLLLLLWGLLSPLGVPEWTIHCALSVVAIS